MLLDSTAKKQFYATYENDYSRSSFDILPCSIGLLRYLYNAMDVVTTAMNSAKNEVDIMIAVYITQTDALASVNFLVVCSSRTNTANIKSTAPIIGRSSKRDFCMFSIGA